ncbi:hypothetical protein NEOC95_001528 [Neochlamydia sp. AcF95]|nr:hypothetical protein [Neochlamydia sp. AcF95]
MSSFDRPINKLPQKEPFYQIRQRINLILLAKPKLPRHLLSKTCGCS